MIKKVRRQIVFFGGIGGSTAVSSQLLNKHHKRNCHVKSQCFNSFFGLISALVLNSGTSTHPPPPLPLMHIILVLTVPYLAGVIRPDNFNIRSVRVLKITEYSSQSYQYIMILHICRVQI